MLNYCNMFKFVDKKKIIDILLEINTIFYQNNQKFF